MKAYDHKKIEKKWQNIWDKKGIYKASDSSKKPKYYSLIEFPYPSGAGMHVGHIRSNTAMDIISRKRRMEGYNVLYPIGWDAFGLPTENYAIKTGIHPIKVTKDNTDTFRRQLKALGFSFDWSREINTTDPKYYKWTQWIFLQFLKKGLAYKAKMNINWCPKDKIGLANEEVVDGCCERCGTAVEKREKEQWMLAITKYADRLDKDLDTVDYLSKIKIQQRNWIGRSEGAEIEFHLTPSPSPLQGEGGRRSGEVVKVFTTRPDTLYGATYLVLAPEHPSLVKLKSKITNWGKVTQYILDSKAKGGIERTKDEKEKTGVELEGIKAINPATSEEISVWVADYVLSNYGTGAIMAVPAHDERDFEFAKKYDLKIVPVVLSGGSVQEGWSLDNYSNEWNAQYSNFGKLINSGRFDGLESEIAKKKIVDFVGGKEKVSFKLRDWVFSRQRYWGEPIPVVHCGKCGVVPVPEKDLPVVLPKVKNYQPTDSGESPLANITKWVNVKCPKCKGLAKRETDTMPNWAGSSWYYLRYIDPKNKKEFASQKNLKYWLGSPKQSGGGTGGVDWYNGGMEHTTLHLLYSRFWHKFLYDLKLVPTSEPYEKRTSHGMILASQGEKMSKSKGNVVNPDDIVKTYGADTLRLYEMFMGPFDQSVSWSTDSLIGPRRFLEKVWKIASQLEQNSAHLTLPGVPGGTYATQNFALATALLHKTIKKVTDDIEGMKFNTAISTLMIFVNEIGKFESIQKEDYENFLKLLSPFAPHITEEIWSNLGHKNSIHLSVWPEYNEALIKDKEIKIVIQINGKVRAEMMINGDDGEDEVKGQALSNEIISKYLKDFEVKKVIYVKNRLLNIVV